METEPKNQPEALNPPENKESAEDLEIARLRTVFGADDAKFSIENAGSDEPKFTVHKKIQVEQNNKPPAEMNLFVEGRHKKDEGVWQIDQGEISAAEGKLSFEKLIPKNHHLVVDPNKEDFYRASDNRISLSKLTNTDDVVVLLHEAGHAKDFNEHPDRRKEETFRTAVMIHENLSHKYSPEDLTRMIKNTSSQERTAWANAIKETRRSKLPLQEKIKERAAFSLATYDERIAGLHYRGSGPEQFMSSGQRKIMRTEQGKKELDNATLKLYGQRAQFITEHIEQETAVLPKNEVFFKSQEKEASYAVRFFGPGAMSVTKLSKHGPAKENLRSISAIVGSARIIHVNEKIDGDITESVNLDILDPKIATLKEAKTVHRIADELFSDVESEKPQLITQTFKALYPDATNQGSLKEMQATSRLYQELKGRSENT
jgi:hypothetical protein